ncbi:MAG: RNA methyltransferase substrate-binding domain-containing protein, partial [Dehalococcoidia bacterium]
MPRMRPKPNATPDDLAFGINACAMAIAAGVAKSLLYVPEARNPRIAELAASARAAGLPIQEAEAWRLDELTAGGVHQGAVVRLNAIEGVDLKAIIKSASATSLVLLLDSVTDPQNLGAVLRTAVAVGADAVVLP